VTILVVGSDRISKISEKLYVEGAKKIIHWNGRNKSFQNKLIPSNVEKVIVLCDFLNHNLMYSIKRQTKLKGIPVVYNKGSLSRKTG